MPGSGAQVVDTHSEEYNSVLGLVPHQMRGYLARFNTMLITGAAFGSCTGCSETVGDGLTMRASPISDAQYVSITLGYQSLRI